MGWILLLFSHWIMSNSLQSHELYIPHSSVLHCLPEFARIHVHWVTDTIQPSHPVSLPSPFAFNLSQHQGLCRVGSLHQVASFLCSLTHGWLVTAGAAALSGRSLWLLARGLHVGQRGASQERASSNDWCHSDSIAQLLIPQLGRIWDGPVDWAPVDRSRKLLGSTHSIGFHNEWPQACWLKSNRHSSLTVSGDCQYPWLVAASLQSLASVNTRPSLL